MSEKTIKHEQFESIQYKRNYLTEVIVRLDYLNPIPSLAEKLPPKIADTAKKHFPIAEPKDVIGKELQISSDELRSRDVRAKEWQFHSKDRDKTFAIGAGALFIRYQKYKSYENLKHEFLDIINVCFDIIPDLQGKRLGLRYVNSIEEPAEKILSWERFINPDILGIIQFAPDPTHISRVFHLLEYNYGDFSLRFQFGLHNPDYPAPIRQRSFILDIDAYYQGVQEKNDIATNLDTFHDKIQEIFELSISDEMRGIMNE